MAEPDDLTKDLNELLARGLRQFVVCGGARNAPILEWISGLDDVDVYSHFEERAAGFFALGRTMVTAEPCAVVVTSGTAVAELLPAVIEAYYQGRPLIVISADRPPRFRGSGSPQAIEQQEILGVYATNDLTFWQGQGPLHLNLCLEEEDQLGQPGPILEPAPPSPNFSLIEFLKWLRHEEFKGIVILLGALDEKAREDVYYFCRDLGVPVLADAASGLREVLAEQALVDGDKLLRENPPGKVLRIGAVPVGRFWRDLEDSPNIDVFSITASGFSGLARESQVLTGPPGMILRGAGEMEEVGDVLEHFGPSRRRANQLDELLESLPEAEPALIRELSLYAAQADSIFLGNSLPVREWNDFAQRIHPVPFVRASRGANGIDGQLSTWLGASVEEGLAWAVVGDVTALYDLAAPHFLAQVVNEKRILIVINNDGGRIFDRLPRLSKMSEPAKKWMRTSHGRSLKDWAKMWDCDYCEVRSREDCEKVESLTSPVTILEVFPNSEQTAQFWKYWK